MMMPNALSTSDAVYVAFTVVVLAPTIFVTVNVPDSPKKDWHAMVDMKGTFCEVLRASKDAYLPAYQ